MEYRKLGKSGLEVSVFAYGDAGAEDTEENQKKTNEVINKCFEVGINYFDSAEFYGLGQHETLLGRALKQSGKKREDYVVSTKIYWEGFGKPNGVGLSRKHLIEGLNGSLKRLQLDYVDIVFAHAVDDDTPLEETVLAFAQIVKEGKAFYWGTSNWNPERIIDALRIADKFGVPGPVAEQCQYNLLFRKSIEKDYTYVIDKFGYGATIWAPVAGGMLTNKYLEDVVDTKGTRWENPLVAKVYSYEKHWGPEKKKASQKKWQQLHQIAKEIGTDSLSLLAQAWAIKTKDVSTAIIGFTKTQYVDDAVQSLALSKKITNEIEEKLDNILGTRPDIGFNWRTKKPYPSRRLA